MTSKNKYLNKTVAVKWVDSYGVEAGWKDISDYSAILPRFFEAIKRKIQKT